MLPEKEKTGKSGTAVTCQYLQILQQLISLANGKVNIPVGNLFPLTFPFPLKIYHSSVRKGKSGR